MELQDWCVSVLGTDFSVEAACHHTHGESQVWRLCRTDGSRCYLKAHRQPGKWAGEVHAYEDWVRPAFGDEAPYLLGASEDMPRAILVSELSGVSMEALDLTLVQKQAAWKQGGRLLARLHGLGVSSGIGGVRRDGSLENPTPVDAAAYLVQRLDDWIIRDKRVGSLTADEVDFIRSAAREWSAALAGEPSVPVHRDYTPRNWIVSPDGDRWIGVIDFEHARWDLRVLDMCRPWTREFLVDPSLADAFFDGYQGGPPDARLAAQILAVRLQHCATSIVWAAEKNEPAFVTESRAGLDVLRSSRRS